MINNEQIVVPIQKILDGYDTIDSKSKVGNAFLRFNRYDSNFNVWDNNYTVSYEVKIGNMEGELLSNNFTLSKAGFQSLMTLIQNNKLSLFSELYILVLEEIAKYKKGTDIHYYLKVILDEPGIAPSIPKVKKKVPICKECDTMLLRFGFQWKIQRDDLNTKNCPYCNKPLVKEERYRKLIKVAIDFEEENCVVDETRAQIGMVYNGTKIKSTINPKGIGDYIKNYQSLFNNNIIGPLVLSFNDVQQISGVEAGIVLEKIEWRPACLFPEDLVAL